MNTTATSKTGKARSVFATVLAIVLVCSLTLSFQIAEPALAADGSSSLKSGQVNTGEGSADVKAQPAGVKNAMKTTSISMTIFKGKQLTLRYGKAKSWKSSNTGIVKVNSRGYVTPKRTGSATVSCKDSYGRTYKCKVTVKKPKITCKWNGWKRLGSYYVDYFTMNNKSGKTFKLKHSAMYWNSWYSKVGLYNPKNLKLLDKSPITIKNKKSSKFVSATTSVYNMYSYTQCWFWFTVGSQDYRVVFKPKTGAMVGCMRD